MDVPKCDYVYATKDELCAEIRALRGEVERLERVSERLDKKLAEEYVKTMKLEAALSRYREAVKWAINIMSIAGGKQWADELRRRAGEGE